MRFVTYKNKLDSNLHFGFLDKEMIIDINLLATWLKIHESQDHFLSIPSSLKMALKDWEINFDKLKEIQYLLQNIDRADLKKYNSLIALSSSEITFLPPVIDPQSFRDFYAFEQHVRAARKLRGLEMHPDWFKIPIFYFSNPSALYGHNASIQYPNGTDELDFELEFAIIIANGGSNIHSDNANNYIGGYTICNDWSARDLQREEMAMSLGPAKGKDFASSFGPYMVTPDELEKFWIDDKLHLEMTCHVNNKLISKGNTNDLYHPFTKMIERASMNTNLIAGDYFGSGTVGTGCILELRPENTNGWLKKGDIIRLEVEQLGILENKII